MKVGEGEQASLAHLSAIMTLPLVIMVAVGGLLVFSKGSVVAPLIYTLF